jgi:hypothetical protein
MTIQPAGSPFGSANPSVTSSEAALEARQGIQDGDEPTSKPAAAKTLAASQVEAAQEAQQGIRDGDEPLAGSKVNTSA